MCVLTDSTGTIWKRAIQVKVTGKFKTVAERCTQTLVYCYLILPPEPSLNAGRTCKILFFRSGKTLHPI